MKSFKLRVLAQVLPFLLVAPAMAPAQTPPNRPPSRSEATAAMKARQNQAGAPYTKQQIDQLIAPIALYPDQLLAQVLMAATYPKQLLEAADWLQDPQHAALKGDELAQALADLQWDPSVKALVAFPPVIAMMTEHIEWTESLGLAFATQQAQVMSRVQALRQLALKSGRIKNVKHVTVREQAGAIEIASAEPDRVYVPVYNPTVIYGHWPDPQNPPVYIAPPRRFASETRETTFETVESGIDVYSYPVVQPLWGWTRPDWRSDRIMIETDEYTRITRGVQPPPDRYWHREGPIVFVAPSAAPPPPQVAVPAGTVAPAQAVAVGVLKEHAASHSDRVRIESSTAAPPAATQQPGTPAEAQHNRNASESGQPVAGGAPSSASAGNAAQSHIAQPEKTQAQQPEKAQAQQPQPEKTQGQHPQAEKAQAQQPQGEKAQAQQPQPGKAQAQQPQPEKAQAQQPQPEKTQEQHPQAEKAQAQQPQPGKAQAQQPQPGKAQAQQPQPEKAQAQQPQPEKAQAQHPQAEKAQAQHPQAEKAQAQHPQAEKAQAQQPQPEKAQAQHPQAEKTQAQHPQAEKAQQAQHPQAAAKPQAEKAQVQTQGPANAAAPAGASPNHAGPAASRQQGAASEMHGQGSSAPPKPAASPPGHEAAAEHHAPHPGPGADQKDTDRKEH
jgi:hypothetical protein